MRNVVTAALLFAASFAASADAQAGDRPTAKQSIASNARASAQSAPDGNAMERKCVIMSCGTPWCYSVKR